MSEHKESKIEHGSMRTYIVGFLLSIILTLGAYIPVVIHQNSYHAIFTDIFLVTFVIALAFVQLFIQLYFFLHLGQEKKPRLNLIFFISTFGLVLLVVVASIWIMNHLNYNMTPAQMNSIIIQEEGIHK